jgi:tetratricopeptide (TPR) repeat protein
MNHTLAIILNVIGITASLAAIIWFCWRWLQGSRDPMVLLTRWILTAFAAGVMTYACIVSGEGYGKLMVVLYGALGGLFLAIVWTPPIVGWVGGLFGSLYDGGTAEPEQLPQYSVYQAKRTKGKYLEALAAVRGELEKFPTDFEGHMLLAGLQADHLDDLPGAELTVHRLVLQPNHLPVNVSYALNQLADWHLKHAKDRDGAQRALEMIVELLPDTEQSLQASQRIAKLASTEALLASKAEHTIVLKKGVDNIGLLDSSSHLKPAEVDMEELAGDYVRHLQRYPLDSDVREKLAMIYANHYQRLDMALDQLEQLVQQPNSQTRQVVHWLNLMVDLMVTHKAPFERMQEPLQRLIEMFPDQPAAEKARRRLDTLRLEMRATEKGRVVQLGTYEQNIGLKGRA